MATENPIPFNPKTMPVSDALKAAETLRDLFGLALREGVSDADIAGQVRAALTNWQKN